MGIREVLTAPRSPLAESLCGAFHRLLATGVFGPHNSIQRVWLAASSEAYFEYYEHTRTHLALVKDAPEARAIQTREAGIVVELPQVGGLHHRYERRAA
jgi:putative transposase